MSESSGTVQGTPSSPLTGDGAASGVVEVFGMSGETAIDFPHEGRYHRLLGYDGAAFIRRVIQCATAAPQRTHYRGDPKADWLGIRTVYRVQGASADDERTVISPPEQYVLDQVDLSLTAGTDPLGSVGDVSAVVVVDKVSHPFEDRDIPEFYDKAQWVLATDRVPSRTVEYKVPKAFNKRFGLWQTPDRKPTLVTSADAFRRAGHRIREEGSLSATVEDVCHCIFVLGAATKSLVRERFFTEFGDIFVRLRADGILHIRAVGREDEKGPIALHYALDPNIEEWTEFTDSHRGVDSILAACVVQWVLHGMAVGAAEVGTGLERIWRLAKYGVRRPEAGHTFEQWVANTWTMLGKSQAKKGLDVHQNVLTVDAGQIMQRNRWSILEACVGSETVPPDMIGGRWSGASKLRKQTLLYSQRVALHGFEGSTDEESKNHKIKFFEVGKYQTVDRSEVESLSGLRRLIAAYQRGLPFLDGAETPISLGVFGAPGSGKSFAVKEVAKGLSKAHRKGLSHPPIDSEILEYNVSQFTSLADLATAMQDIREKRLFGRVPVVIFDEFDAKFENQSFGWLKYFLMPMQDGKFRDNQRDYRTGGCVMIFAGGINHSFAEFVGRMRDKDFSIAKGPDFISRLRAVHNIPTLAFDDQPFPQWQIRRASIIKYNLKKYKLKGIAPVLLDALLTVERFHHGARSLEAIIQMATPNGRGRIDISSLPRRDQLDLHVDSNRLWYLLEDKGPIYPGLSET